MGDGDRFAREVGRIVSSRDCSEETVKVHMKDILPWCLSFRFRGPVIWGCLLCQVLEFLLELGLPCAEVMKAGLLVVLFEEVGVEGGSRADTGVGKEGDVGFGEG